MPGLHETEFIRQILREINRVTCTVVEPTNEAAIMKHVLETSPDLNDVKFSWRHEKLEDYAIGPFGGQKHHVISAIHSLYYMNDLENQLRCLLSSLEEGGFLFAVLESGKVLLPLFLYTNTIL